jgi:hypothetical protein
MDLETVSAAFANLSTSIRGEPPHVELDARRRVLRVPNAPRYNPPANPNVLRGWWNQWREVPESPLKYRHIESLRAAVNFADPKLAAVWAETFGTVTEPSANRSATVSPAVNGPVPEPLPTQEQDQEQDQDPPPAVVGPPAAGPTKGDGQGGLFDAPGPPEAGGTPPRRRRRSEEPLPFTVAEALDAMAATARGRFVAGRVDGGIAANITRRIRSYPDLGTWRLVGEYLAAGGCRRRDPLGPSWVASSAFNDAVACARLWAEKGRGQVREGAPATHGYTPAPGPEEHERERQRLLDAGAEDCGEGVVVLDGGGGAN